MTWAWIEDDNYTDSVSIFLEGLTLVSVVLETGFCGTTLYNVGTRKEMGSMGGDLGWAAAAAKSCVWCLFCGMENGKSLFGDTEN